MWKNLATNLFDSLTFSFIVDCICLLNLRCGFVLMGLAAATMFIAFLFFPESYRWLVKNDRNEDALASLLFFNKDPEMVQDMFERVKELMQKEKSSTGTSSAYISTCICVTVRSKRRKSHTSVFFW